jgi:hypothetical protein
MIAVALAIGEEPLMSRETSDFDLKLSFDPESRGAMLELVKDLVAMANSGGGTIRLGATETERPGIDMALLTQLDGARVADQINRYVAPSRAEVSHAIVEQLDGDRIILDLTVGPAGKYPMVFAKQGQYPSRKGNKSAFREGDIYIRHGAKSEPATYQDIVRLIDQAVADREKEGLHRIKALLERVARLPDDFEPTLLVQNRQGEIVNSSEAIIDIAVQRRRDGYRGSVVDGAGLLTCFLERADLELTPERLDMLIRSALRRAPTLFFWLAEVKDLSPIGEVLVTSLSDADRDKSDAKGTIPEVAALFADDVTLAKIIKEMEQSRYKHFRDAAGAWSGRLRACEKFMESAASTMVDGVPATILSTEKLVAHAEQLAKEILGKERATAESRLMTNIGRVILERAHPYIPGMQ